MADWRNRIYGRSQGNGPRHLMAASDAAVSLCGRRCNYLGPRGAGTAGKLCTKCRTAERRQT